MISRRTALSACGGALAALAAPCPAQALGFGDLISPPRSLEAIARRLERDYPNLDHLRPEVLASHLAMSNEVRLFDVREADEFAVSHLRNAERLSPAASPTAALRQIGADVSGRRVVFYCSVGQRSSRMADRVQDALMSSGARGVHNLRAGIFAWHNRSLPLVDALGPTRYVHPFNAAWGRLLDRPLWASTGVR